MFKNFHSRIFFHKFFICLKNRPGIDPFLFKFLNQGIRDKNLAPPGISCIILRNLLGRIIFRLDSEYLRLQPEYQILGYENDLSFSVFFFIQSFTYFKDTIIRLVFRQILR